MAVRRYRGFTIETLFDGLYASVRQYDEHLKKFDGPRSYENAKRWVDEQIEAEEFAEAVAQLEG